MTGMDHETEHEQVLTLLRDWLDRSRVECAQLDDSDDSDDAIEPCEPVGMLQVVEQLTALRHDAKLLTKAVRGTEERHEATLLSLQAAIEQFRSVKADEEAAADRAARPLVEAIVELDEALVRCRAAIEQAKYRIVAETHAEFQATRERLETLYQAQPRWRRWLCRPWHQAAQAIYGADTLNSYHTIFDALLEGYGLIENRLRRAMQQDMIVRIPCLGEPADPNRMTVVEIVSDPTRRPGTVVEEVRPGYCWNGRVLRFAEVKAVGQP
jgi:molecular chaperone GrpE